MRRYISLLLFIGMMFGQDVLKTVSGKEYKGKYLKTEGGKVFFIPEGASSSIQVPIESIKEIITETGEKISLLSTLIMKDGTVIKGSLAMISIDAIRFLKENETTPVDIQKDDIKSLTGIDGEIDLNNIDVKSAQELPDQNTIKESIKISELAAKAAKISIDKNNKINSPSRSLMVNLFKYSAGISLTLVAVATEFYPIGFAGYGAMMFINTKNKFSFDKEKEKYLDGLSKSQIIQFSQIYDPIIEDYKQTYGQNVKKPQLINKKQEIITGCIAGGVLVFAIALHDISQHSF